MKILLTNDDGIDGAGLWALARAFYNRNKFEAVIVAPMRQQSGMAHALTVGRKMEFWRVKHPIFEAWIIDGTPTDCVKIYLEEMAKGEKISAVISGINDGANLATDVLYSGTVGGALEGFLHEIPALAVSRDIQSEISFEDVASVTAKYFEEQFARGENFFYNVNFPKKYRAEQAEFKFCRLGRRDYTNAFIRHEIEGRNFFEIRGEIIDLDKSDGTDIFAVENGYVSVTPLHIDVTHHEKISAD